MKQPLRRLLVQTRREIDKVKGSRFIATALPIAGVDEIDTVLDRLRHEFPAATHHVFAYRLGARGETHRYNDDGEPSGSAGRPVLQQLEARGLTDTLVVVTRFFGGTKLGVGGLARAYGRAAAAALQAGGYLDVVATRRVVVRFRYEQSGAARAALAARNLEPVRSDFGAEVTLWLDVPEEDVESLLRALQESTAGRIRIEG